MVINVAKCDLGEVKLKSMLPAVILICASNLLGGHLQYLQGRITCAWLQANTVDHHLPIFADSFSRCESLQINSAVVNRCRLIQRLLTSFSEFWDSGPFPSHPFVVKIGKYGQW